MPFSLPSLLQVIFKVYEEKEQSWHKEYKKLRTQFESSLMVRKSAAKKPCLLFFPSLLSLSLFIFSEHVLQILSPSKVGISCDSLSFFSPSSPFSSTLYPFLFQLYQQKALKAESNLAFASKQVGT